MVAAVTFGDDPIFVLGRSVAHPMGVPGFWPAYFLTGLGVGTIFGALVPKRGFASTPIVVRGGRQSAEPAHTRRAALPLVVLAVAVMIFVVAPGPWVCAAAAAAAGIAGLVTGSTAQALLLQLATPVYALQVMTLWGHGCPPGRRGRRQGRRDLAHEGGLDGQGLWSSVVAVSL
jgi:hypothetical protein